MLVSRFNSKYVRAFSFRLFFFSFVIVVLFFLLCVSRRLFFFVHRSVSLARSLSYMCVVRAYLCACVLCAAHVVYITNQIANLTLTAANN